VTVRKHRNFAHGFGMPSPYNPMEGVYADIQTKGVFPYCAMMQVAAADTHADYVICRGFDVRIRKFINYVEGDTTNSPGIPVAKPYGNRVTGVYTIGQMFPAILPLQTGGPSPTGADIRFGQNPGVAATSSGHPADLDEEVEILKTDEDVVINWMLLEGGSGAKLWRFTLNADIAAGTADADKLELDGTDTEEDVTVTDVNGQFAGLKDTCYGICLEAVDADGDLVYAIVGVPLKEHCKFTLDAELQITDSSASATITSQWGQGQDHPSTAITVNNCNNIGGSWQFYGGAGYFGIATYSGSGTTWNIVQLNCLEEGTTITATGSSSYTLTATGTA